MKTHGNKAGLLILSNCVSKQFIAIMTVLNALSALSLDSNRCNRSPDGTDLYKYYLTSTVYVLNAFALNRTNSQHSLVSNFCPTYNINKHRELTTDVFMSQPQNGMNDAMYLCKTHTTNTTHKTNTACS